MNALYNEIEPYAAEWLDNLITAGHIAPGRVERRSIADLAPADVAGRGQRHFFAGIGGWSLALRLAGIPDDADVWTGSCPCQPFSDAGKRSGTRDARHLWPTWFGLIRECRPPAVFGEQVASRAGLAWFDAVRADLEGCGYAVGASDLCAAGVGAPHIRQRLYFVAYARDERREGERLRVQPGQSRTTGPEAGGQPDSRSSWATPAAHEAGGTPKGFLMRKRKARAKGASLGESLTSLSMQAAIAVSAPAGTADAPIESTATSSPEGCDTPMAPSAWATPLSTNSRGQPDLERWKQRKQKSRPGSVAVTELNMQAQSVAPWATPLKVDGEGGRRMNDGKRGATLREQLHGWTPDRGPTSSGSPASTERRGQLNPDLSRWLMGYPVEWLFAAPSNKPTPRFKKRSTGTTAPARSRDSATPMTIAIATGQTRTAPCGCCAVLVKQSQYQHAPGGVHWSSPNHDALCGLPCLGGGVGPKAYRLGEFHRSPERCPRCAPGSDPRRNERDDAEEAKP